MPERSAGHPVALRLVVALVVAVVLGALYVGTADVGWAIAFVCAPLLLVAVDVGAHLRAAGGRGAEAPSGRPAVAERTVEQEVPAVVAPTGQEPQRAAEPAGRSERPRSDLQTADLTARELEILRMMAEGSSTDEIADALVLSRGTVREHTASITRKIGVRDLREAIEALRRAERLR